MRTKSEYKDNTVYPFPHGVYVRGFWTRRFLVGKLENYVGTGFETVA